VPRLSILDFQVGRLGSTRGDYRDLILEQICRRVLLRCNTICRRKMTSGPPQTSSTRHAGPDAQVSEASGGYDSWVCRRWRVSRGRGRLMGEGEWSAEGMQGGTTGRVRSWRRKGFRRLFVAGDGIVGDWVSHSIGKVWQTPPPSRARSRPPSHPLTPTRPPALLFPLPLSLPPSCVLSLSPSRNSYPKPLTAPYQAHPAHDL